MMMSAQKGEEFRKYRDIAPEGVEDAAIMSLIQKSAGNHSAISAAIENMWHDLPDEKAIGGLDQWNTTSKSNKKKEVPQPQGGDRGGRGGRGRSMTPAGGRGQGAVGGRGENRVGGRGAPPPGRGASAPRPAPVSPQPTPVYVAPSEPVAAPAPSNGGSGWGSGGVTLAEKLKQAEIQKLLPPSAPVVEIVTVETEVYTDGDASTATDIECIEEQGETQEEVEVLDKVEIIAEVEVVEVVEQIAELTIEPVVEVVEVIEIPMALPEPVAPVHIPEVIQQVQEIQEVPKAFLKMGKWEAPLDTSSFQFGSFGNFASTNEDPISMSAPTPWGGVVAESADQQQGDAAVWGATGSVEASTSSSSGPSPMSSLFPAPKGLPSVPSDNSPTGSSSSQQGRYDQKPLAPPGLDPHPHGAMSKPLPARQDSRTVPPGQTQSRGKHEANQQLQQQQLQQQQYQYQQPAAAPAAAVRGAPAAAAMPYGYAPGFEPQSQYQPPYQPAPVMPAPAAGSSPVAAVGAPAAQGQGQASVAPQAQQQSQLQYGPPPGMPNHYGNPYYANPYYGNPGYFYGQPQVPNPYYNQGRDYNASRPYGADPYAPGVQYPVYQQGGGFPDASGSYPNMPMQQQHPSMGAQGQGAAAAPAPAAGGGQGKQQKAASSAAIQQQQQQDPNQGYGYNHYNPRDAPWQQYQQAAQWGAPMMGFPQGPGQSPPTQGFSQPPQQSAGQGQRPSTSYGGPPGQHGQGQQHQAQQGQQGQSFSRGPAPGAAGPSSGGSGQHW